MFVNNMIGSKYRILLVEDEHNLANVIQDYLNMSNYITTIAYDGESGLNTFCSNKFDLCILDIMLPKLDGFTLAKEIKRIDNEIPIIFLSAKSLKEDRIKGLKLGADDYIVKPFSTEELKLRIEAILKRFKHIKPDKNVFNIGKYIFDYTNYTLKIENKIQKVTKREADLLKLLCMNMGTILLRKIALETIWGIDYQSTSRTLDVYIIKIKRQLKEDPKVIIENIHGSGFKLIVLK